MRFLVNPHTNISNDLTERGSDWTGFLLLELLDFFNVGHRP